MELTEIVVTNDLPTGTAFGATLDATPEGVFIPGRVAAATGIQVGQRVMALLVPNTTRPERTPWMAARIELIPGEAAVVAGVTSSVQSLVRAEMKEGGVWTVATLFAHLFPNETRLTATAKYTAISNTVRSMFAAGECAKFQLWRSADQSKPGREWFTCYPERADVDEWAE